MDIALWIHAWCENVSCNLRLSKFEYCIFFSMTWYVLFSKFAYRRIWRHWCDTNAFAFVHDAFFFPWKIFYIRKEAGLQLRMNETHLKFCACGKEKKLVDLEGSKPSRNFYATTVCNTVFMHIDTGNINSQKMGQCNFSIFIFFVNTYKYIG